MIHKTLNTAIVGATGYVGLDLINLLQNHPNVKITSLCAKKNIDKNIDFFDQRIKKKLPKITNVKKVNWSKIDVLFLSLPNGEAQRIIKKLFNKYPNIVFIDLSADFRLEKPNLFRSWYKKKHICPELIKNSIYSISEFTKKKIKNFRIISNPGCYPTSIQLALMPILKKNIIYTKNIIIDAKSGYSGAGKTFEKKFKHKNLYKSTFPYSVIKHRHIAEMDQEIKKHSGKKVEYIFNPHIIPSFRGIISSIYIETKKNVSGKKILDILKNYYKNDKFIKIAKYNKAISTGEVLNTNNCQISVCSSRYKNKYTIFSTIDNLIKGASGQAIQNMNLAFGLGENIGLK